MKKVAIGVVVIIVLAALAAPPLLGRLTESTIRENLATFDENPAMTFSVESFDRGWFSSTARVGVGLDPNYAGMLGVLDPAVGGPAAAVFGESAIFVVDIEHGPIMLRNGLYVGLSRLVARLDESIAALEEIRTRLAMPYLVEIRGRLGLGGTFSYDADVPPIDYADENGQVYFSGLTTDGTYSGGHHRASGRIDEATLDSVTAAGEVRGVSAAGEGDRINAYLSAGTIEISVDSMTFTNPLLGADATFNVGRLRVTGDTRLDDTGELLSGTLVYAVDSVTSGQAFTLDDIEVSVAANDLSLAAITSYYDTMLGLDQSDPSAAFTALQAIGAQLLARNPSLALSPIRFEYNGEPFVANVEVRTVGDTSGGLDFSNPMLLASLFEVSADATASRALATELATLVVQGQLAMALEGQELPPGEDLAQIAEQQAEVMLATFLGQGLIVEAGDNYTTSLEYANGEITVNGTPLPLGMMFQ